MSSDEALAPVIPSGYYHVKYGANAGVGGAYLTAGKPGTPATIQALSPQPLGKTQTFKVVYNRKTRKYTLRTDGQHGISYAKAVERGPIITSPLKPHSFKIGKVRKSLPPFPPGPKLYRIGLRVSGRSLVIGQSRFRIFPPRLELQALSPQAVWQFQRVRHEDHVDEEDAEEEEEEEHSDEEFSDGEFSDEFEE
jgi:hypothetical protein